jgi:hypothetical protein
MRKMKIGIFAIATVILFLLSTSVSVTATTYQETLMELTSGVQEENPRAYVSMDPQDVWSNTDWNWTLDINDGDNVYIDTECIWINGNIRSSPPAYTGYHYYYVEGDYRKGIDHINDWDDLAKYTYGRTMGTEPEQGSDTLTLEFDNLEEGGTISLYWYVYAENYKTPSVDADMEHTGTVYLT